jgi:hypothetical protein
MESKHSVKTNGIHMVIAGPVFILGPEIPIISSTMGVPRPAAPES